MVKCPRLKCLVANFSTSFNFTYIGSPQPTSKPLKSFFIWTPLNGDTPRNVYSNQTKFDWSKIFALFCISAQGGVNLEPIEKWFDNPAQYTRWLEYHFGFKDQPSEPPTPKHLLQSNFLKSESILEGFQNSLQVIILPVRNLWNRALIWVVLRLSLFSSLLAICKKRCSTLDNPWKLLDCITVNPRKWREIHKSAYFLGEGVKFSRWAADLFHCYIYKLFSKNG